MLHQQSADNRTPALENAEANTSAYSLDNHGLANLGSVYWNLPPDTLTDEAVSRGEGLRSQHGEFVPESCFDTAPAVNDRFVVRDSDTEDLIWWGENNRPFLAQKFSAVYQRVQAYLQGRDLFVQDGYAGGDPRHRLPVRVITESAWQNLFAQNLLFQSQTSEEMQKFIPEFTIISVPGFEASPMIDSTMSERFVLLNLDQKLCLIGGTGSNEEIRYAISKVMHFVLARQSVLPLFCSAVKAIKNNEDIALFFGLPNTDKIAMIENEKHQSIADRGLGWTDDGVFGFVGGVASHPKNIFLLACDATGVLPPIARLTPEQAAYYFISGYSSTVSDSGNGSERPPVTTFAPGFGASLMVSHPLFYADWLRNKILRLNVNCWLVNTGRADGSEGTGERIFDDQTHTLLKAAQEGKLSRVEYLADEVFGFEVPTSCPGIPDGLLRPADTKERRAQLAALFVENFRKYADGCPPEIIEAGPRL